MSTLRFASLYTCVDDKPNQFVNLHPWAHVRGPHADSQGHNSTFGTRVWTTRRLTRSQLNIWYMCVDDTPNHKITTRQLVHVCGRHADPFGHNATFGTSVWTTRRFTKSQINILHMCVDDNSNCNLGERTCGVRNKVGSHIAPKCPNRSTSSPTQCRNNTYRRS